ELVGGLVEERARRQDDRRVVDEPVDAAVLGDGVRDDALPVAGDGDVVGHDVGALGAGDVGGDGHRALLPARPGDDRAEGAAAAGDDHDLAFQQVVRHGRRGYAAATSGDASAQEAAGRGARRDAVLEGDLAPDDRGE